MDKDISIDWNFIHDRIMKYVNLLDTVRELLQYVIQALNENTPNEDEWRAILEKLEALISDKEDISIMAEQIREAMLLEESGEGMTAEMVTDLHFDEDVLF
jgi:DNA repair ATPase RecN